MQEKESVMVVRCELKIPSLGYLFGITRLRTATLVTEFSIRTEQPLKILIVFPKRVDHKTEKVEQEHENKEQGKA